MTDALSSYDEEHLAEQRALAWDRQIEIDALAGKFDAMASQARAELRAGKATPLFPLE